MARAKEENAAPREIELKLQFRPEDRERLECSLPASGAARRQRLVTT
jgi:hypothetical protein